MPINVSFHVLTQPNTVELGENPVGFLLSRKRQTFLISLREQHALFLYTFSGNTLDWPREKSYSHQMAALAYWMMAAFCFQYLTFSHCLEETASSLPEKKSVENGRDPYLKYILLPCTKKELSNSFIFVLLIFYYLESDFFFVLEDMVAWGLFYCSPHLR